MFYILDNTCQLLLLYFKCSSRCAVVVVLICVSRVTNAIEHLFKGFFAVWIVPVFKNWVVFLLLSLLVFSSSLRLLLLLAVSFRSKRFYIWWSVTYQFLLLWSYFGIISKSALPQPKSQRLLCFQLNFYSLVLIYYLFWVN